MWSTTLPGDINPELKAWLTDAGSMTKRIKKHDQDKPTFKLKLLEEDRGCPIDKDEAIFLDPYEMSETIRYRRVTLGCFKEDWIYGHSLFPKALAEQFAGLGDKPLGTMLFSDSKTQRIQMDFQLIDKEHSLYKQIPKSKASNGEKLWARRSVFSRDGYNLIVYEVFLPALCKRLEKKAAKNNGAGPSSPGSHHTPK